MRNSDGLSHVWWIGRLRVRYTHRDRAAFMGRFGGGWQWKLGLQAGGRTLIVSLLVAELRFDWDYQS